MTRALGILFIAGCSAHTAAPPATPASAFDPLRQPVVSQPPPRPLRMLEPTTHEDAFPVVELTPSGTDVRLQPVDWTLTRVWTGRAAQQAYEVYGCMKDGVLARLVVKMWPKTGPERFDVLSFPDLTYFAKADRRNWNNRAGCGGERPVFRDDGQVEIFDQWTKRSVATVEGAWPAGKPSSIAERPGTPGIWELTWPTAAFVIDVATRTVTTLPLPHRKEPDSRFEHTVGDDSNCTVGHRRMGNRVWVLCAGRDRSRLRYLWDPTEHTIQRVDGDETYSLRAPTNDALPWAVKYYERPAIVDEATGSVLRLPTGSLRLYEPMLDPRSYLGISDDLREVRRYDLDARTFDVLRRYDDGDCPGLIGVAGAARRQERFVVVRCVKADAKQAPQEMLHSTLVWTDLIDLEARTVWRTRLAVHELLPDGSALVTDARRLDNWSYFRNVWVAAPGAR